MIGITIVYLKLMVGLIDLYAMQKSKVITYYHNLLLDDKTWQEKLTTEERRICDGFALSMLVSAERNGTDIQQMYGRVCHMLGGTAQVVDA